MYSAKQRQFMLKLARDAIKHYLDANLEPEIDPKEIDPDLKEFRGVFVTLTIGKNLRGCIGHIMPVQELYKDIIDNAINAAFDDPRFNPLDQSEFDQIKIEISVLSLPQKLEYKNSDDLLKKLKPLKDGVIIKKSWAQATYLPQVWEDLADKTAFLSSLCLKAGLSADEWQKGGLEVQTYTVEKFEEQDA